MSDVTADDLLANAARLTSGSESNDFVGADAFVAVVRQLSDARYLDLSGPFPSLRLARATALQIESEFGDDRDDYFVEIRPLYYSQWGVRAVPMS